MRSRVVRACSSFALMLSLAGTAQGVQVAQAHFVWVEPHDGCDGASMLDSGAGGVGDPDRPFKTLGAAINAMSGHLATQGPQDYGIVIANPGVYDEEQFPIILRDRVCLQGVGARRCIIRPGQQFLPNTVVFVPEDPFASSPPECGSTIGAKVLLDLRFARTGQQMEDTFEEFIDGFTFEGGEVQIYCYRELEVRTTISNCIFNLAAGGDAAFRFGILLVHEYLGEQLPYADIPLNVLNNTFLLSYISDNQILSAPIDSVGIVDVNDPRCDSEGDLNTVLRGVGNPSIQNNLFRTLADSEMILHTITLGVDDTDTSVSTGETTNAFDSSAVDDRSAGLRFYAELDDPGYTFPTPANNSDLSQDDPGFIGELLGAYFPALSSYHDWRLHPSTPLRDEGHQPDLVQGFLRLEAANLTLYEIEVDSPRSSFDWDMEYYGNPRISGVNIDIGADEFHSMIMAGSYSNDDTSHHLSNGQLTSYRFNDPILGWTRLNIPAGPTRNRRVFVDSIFAGDSMQVWGRSLQPVTIPSLPGGPPQCEGGAVDSPLLKAWTYMPGTMQPPLSIYQATPPPSDYQLWYMAADILHDAPTPWVGSVSSPAPLSNPVSGQLMPTSFFLLNGTSVTIPDLEGSDSYFTTQGRITHQGSLYATNAQSEYR